MKQIKILLVAIGCIALVCAGASSVSAQALDDTWYQVVVSIKGETVDLDDGTSGGKIRIKRTAYLYIADNAGDYVLTLFSETAEDVWSATVGGSIPPTLINDDVTYMPSRTWTIETPDPTTIMFYLSGIFKIKLKKDDSLKKATFSTSSVALITTQMNPDNDLPFGKIKVKIKMIDVDDLPAGVPLP